jgi:hypothetical protein
VASTLPLKSWKEGCDDGTEHISNSKVSFPALPASWPWPPCPPIWAHIWGTPSIVAHPVLAQDRDHEPSHAWLRSRPETSSSNSDIGYPCGRVAMSSGIQLWHRAGNSATLSCMVHDRRLGRRFCKNTGCIIDSAIRQAEVVQPGGHGAFPHERGCAPLLRPRPRPPSGQSILVHASTGASRCYRSRSSMARPSWRAWRRWPRAQSPWWRRTLWPAHEHV